MIDETKYKNDECAKLKVTITTACGLVPVKNASVSVAYNGPDGCCEKEKITFVTNNDGKTNTFFMYSKRARIGERYVIIPKYSRCDVMIEADGYVPLKVREVPIFPGITVVRAFDLIPIKNIEVL